MAKKSGKVRRVMRHQRVRKKVIGTPERPRLAVYRSLNNIYAQVISIECYCMNTNEFDIFF